MMVCDLKIKTKLTDVLGEEMFNVCLADPVKALAFSQLLSFAIADFDKTHNLDAVISNKLLEVRAELGEELCLWYAKNHQGLVDILTILNSHLKTSAEVKQIKETLHQLLAAIDANNYEAKITSLLSASQPKAETKQLLELIEKAQINQVRDLFRLSTLTLDERTNVPLFNFLKWLSEDKQASLRDGLHSLFKKHRDKEIIRKRAQGATLEETSTTSGLTHEGVRLIEKKFQNRFDDYIAKLKPHYILYAFGKNNCYISFAELKERLGDLATIFTYCLKVSNCPTAHWSDELNGFIIGDGKWYEQFKNYKKDLPEILACESVAELIADIIKKLALPLEFNATKSLVLADYNLSGKVYLKKRISLSRMYFAVLEKYYPNGIKLYDDSESIRFRNYVRSLFGDVYLPENNRAIDVRLTELTILCDRGKRILPSGIKIPRELLSKIHDAIIQLDRNVIMFMELFERFKNELLENSNITNKYFLQGVLRQNYSNEFDFTRYTLKKDPSLNSNHFQSPEKIPS
ncbi:MAG: hypothetical protein P4L49_08985 [Desulfosporosinus sp.]|nr:hypothetical protein [Desulfosporosinus sp.]